MAPSRIGIFWYYKKRVLAYWELADDVKECGGFKDVEMGHYQYWPKLQQQVKDFIYLEYEEVPRGRVVFNVVSKTFKVISSAKLIRGAVFRKHIIAEFNLPEKRVVFETDEHYGDPGKIDWDA